MPVGAKEAEGQMAPEFSILVVCLNAGDKLRKTLESIRGQTFGDYEVIIKDGGSSDGSPALARKIMERAGKESSAVSYRLIEKKDAGIYDAMNQAVQAAAGRYLYFLNCGDVFYDETVLEQMHGLIRDNPCGTGIYYGNIFERLTGQEVASNPALDAFGCYRNVPCHQACFYDRKLLLSHPFDVKYRVRADYEQFLWCFFAKRESESVSFVYGKILIADYEGGGFSETKKNRRISAREHREIVRNYMSAGQVFKYRMIMWVSLAPLRAWIAGNPLTSGCYNKLKKRYYEKDRGV